MGWLRATVVDRRQWAPGLVSLKLDQSLPHEAGQFVTLALGEGEARIKRPYSVASAEGAQVEVYLSQVDEGQLSPPLTALGVGDGVWLEDQARGFFTLKWIPKAEVAWMLCTGTGVGPFLSMLRADAIWSHFQHVVLVHGARLNAHLGYREELSQWVARRPGRLTYLPMVTREMPSSGVLQGRIPDRIADGFLEQSAGRSLGAETAHVLLCGNPSMIVSVQELLLQQRGMRPHRRRQPGQISFERYW